MGMTFFPALKTPRGEAFPVLLFALLACMASGCSRQPFPLAAVSGTVLLDGQPLAGGVVNFQPIATEKARITGPGSTGRTGPDGRFTLQTITRHPGAVIGPHRVKIYSYSPETPVATEGDTGPRLERVPDRYNYRSELTFEVPAAGTSTADFSLSTKPGTGKP